MKEMPMKKSRLAIGVTVAAVLLAFSGTTALAQDREQRNDQPGHTQFDDHDQQVTRDWYNQHRDNAPAGLRNEDRLSADEESRLHEGAVLDKHLRRKVHAAPSELTHLLPPPAHNHRYVTIGGHVGMIDNKNHVKGVIHLHDNQ
jgi:Ni/Co efflux regulator RcnB